MQKINLRFFQILFTPLILKNYFQATCDQTHSGRHMDAEKKKHAPPPILTPKHPVNIVQND